jgi:hypothetical protein
MNDDRPIYGAVSPVPGIPRSPEQRSESHDFRSNSVPPETKDMA